MKERGTVLFNASKQESFKLNQHFKTLHRRLKDEWNVSVNKEPLNATVLTDVRLLLMTAPCASLNATELDTLRSYLSHGGRLLITSGSGGETSFPSNINFLLEEFGIMINTDSVVRPEYFKYFHPKECLISDGVLNTIEIFDKEKLEFVYPFGATLSVVKPAKTVLSTGTVAVPVQRPILAIADIPGGGRLFVSGSTLMLCDSYIDKEENGKLVKSIFEFLLNENVLTPIIEKNSAWLGEYSTMSSMAQLADKPRVSLQKPAVDTHGSLSTRMFEITLDHFPTVLSAYENLNIKHEPLRIIAPEFESPLPPLEPAVFPPVLRELPPPALELFDLEDAFSSDRTKLAHITNKFLGSHDSTDLELFCFEVFNSIGMSPTTTTEEGVKSSLRKLAMEMALFKRRVR